MHFSPFARFCTVTLPAACLLATPYTITTISAPGATHTLINGINNAGQAVGYATSEFFTVTSSFIWKGGVFTPLNVPEAYETRPMGINDHGRVVGNYPDQEWNYVGFDYSNGNFEPVLPIEETPTMPHAVSNNGWIGGSHFYNFVGTFGFTRSPSGETTGYINPGRWNATVVYGINNFGTAVGRTLNFGANSPAFIRAHDGSQLTYDAPDAISTEFRGINEAGQIVGFARACYGCPATSFLFINNTFQSLNLPISATSVMARDINELGQIVGSYIDESGIEHGFLATPIPEPQSSALILVALAAAGIRLRRRQAS